MLSPRYVTHHTLQLGFKRRGNADVTKRLQAVSRNAGAGSLPQNVNATNSTRAQLICEDICALCGLCAKSPCSGISLCNLCGPLCLCGVVLLGIHHPQRHRGHRGCTEKSAIETFCAKPSLAAIDSVTESG